MTVYVSKMLKHFKNINLDVCEFLRRWELKWDFSIFHIFDVNALRDSYKAITGSVRLFFFYPANWNRNFWFVKVSIETDWNSWKIIGFGLFRFWSVPVFGPVRPLVFFPKIFCLGFFYIKKKMQYSSLLFYGPFML